MWDCSDIPVADLKAIMAQVNTQGKQLYITQEVVQGTASVKPSDYTVIGHVQEYVVSSTWW